MKIAFLTEMGFEGKVPSSHPNARTEFAWMNALDATHFNIRKIENVKEYDIVFIILPKGETYLNAVGVTISQNQNPIKDILKLPLIDILKKQNCKKIYFYWI